MNEQQGLDPMFQENGSQWMEGGLASEPLNVYTAKTFGWMFLGLLVTFGTAIAFSAGGGLYYLLTMGMPAVFALAIAEIVVVMVLSARLHKLSIGAARGLFFAYAVLNGITFSAVFFAYDVQILLTVFALTSLYFGVLAVLLFLARPLLDTTAADREWSIHFLFPCLLACIILTTVVSFCRFAAKPDQKPKPRYVGWKQPILMLANAAYLFATLEFVTNSQFREMKWYYALLNIGVIFVLSILVSLFLNSIRRAMIFMNIFYFCMSLVFYYVYLFRGEAFQLIDLYSIATAADVVGGYKFEITGEIVTSFITMMLVVRLWLQSREYRFARKTRNKILLRVAAAALTLGTYLAYMNLNWNAEFGVISDLWNPAKTYRQYGTTVGFTAVAKYMRLTPPDGYSKDEVTAIADTSEKETKTEDLRKDNADSVTPVNIIAIMNESWFDYRSVGDPQTSESYMPFLDSLTENIIKGHTLTCTKGGGTAKTEYEFLTGNSCKHSR